MIKKVAEWTQQLQEQMAMDPKDPYYGMLLSRVGCPHTARKMREEQNFSLGVWQRFPFNIIEYRKRRSKNNLLSFLKEQFLHQSVQKMFHLIWKTQTPLSAPPACGLDTVGPVIIEFRYYCITTIWIFISQLADNIRTKICRDARYYLPELNCSFTLSFGPQADCLEP